MQGRAQKFEKGGPQFKAKPAGPNIVKSKKRKKGHQAHTCPTFRPNTSKKQKKVIKPALVQFSAQRQVKRKKKGQQHALRLSFLRISPLLAFVWGGGGAAPAPPPPLSAPLNSEYVFGKRDEYCR